MREGGSVIWRLIIAHGWWLWSAIGRRSGSSRSSFYATSPRIHSRQGSVPVLIVRTPRGVARKGNTSRVIALFMQNPHGCGHCITNNSPSR